MKFSFIVAIALIASCVYSTRATGQNVYRCGNTYSQKPCADGIALDFDDARTAEQKAQSDAQIKHDAAAGNAMEKARLKEEAEQRAINAKLAAASAKASSAKTKDSSGGTKPANKPPHKKKSTKKKEPKFFSTRTPTEKSKKAASTSN
ncbi:MAG TPA: hypothetical protein PKH72_10300 [Rhodoferax sp.]|mgnify:CR=1 FL=1|jgi:hypothetical protein|nr:hypothetical protein [Rhodoferax sp.]HNV60035.1 hypothetical protein [Rhodoferax sp.]HPW29405.1 hypothetical protein [Rhodoferax sp.]